MAIIPEDTRKRKNITLKTIMTTILACEAQDLNNIKILLEMVQLPEISAKDLAP
jgi:hypothetical protein